jgi:hypothetical protein
MDPQQGQTPMLWQNQQQMQTASVSLAHTTITSLSFSPKDQAIAFITAYKADVVLWLLSLKWVQHQLQAVNLVQLLAPCPGCTHVTWTPSGMHIILASRQGIVALNLATGAQQPITSSPRDSDPTCAPDGSALAFLNAAGIPTILPATDCVPAPLDVIDARYLNGYTHARELAWSLDGTQLAFTADVGGAPAVFVSNTAAFGPTVSNAAPTVAQRISDARCADPMWARQRHSAKQIVLFVCSAIGMGQWHHMLVAVPDVPNATWKAMMPISDAQHDLLTWLPDLPADS